MASASTTGRRTTRFAKSLLAPSGAGEVVVAPAPSAAKPRYHAFDALRGMAMFLVIGLHAALAYVGHDIKGVLWCVRDAPTWLAFDWFCWWSMGVSNPLYFTIAGFFAVMLYDAKGLKGFLDNRGRRVLGPLLVGIVTILPACMAAWSYGWLVSGRASWKELRRIKFHDPILQTERYGSGHLWFLEYLMAMLVAYGLARWAFQRRGLALEGLRRLGGWWIGSAWAPFLLAVPTTALLWLSRQKMGVDAILDRHNSFLIDPVKLAYHSAYFVVGLLLYTKRHDLARIARPAFWFLALSVPAFVARAWLMGLDQQSPLQGTRLLALMASGALFSWLMVFGAIGAAFRVCRKESPTLSYLADSSYWIYLIHMPVLGLIQGDLYRVPGHAAWKAPLVLSLTLAIGFGTYQCLVRHTALGEALHGRRKRPEPTTA